MANAKLCPIGKCLADALESLVEQDATAKSRSSSSSSSMGLKPTRKRKRTASSEIISMEDHTSGDDGDTTSDEDHNVSKGAGKSAETNTDTFPVFNTKMARQILSTFGDSVTEHCTTSSPTMINSEIPPDALLRGKVQYYNRLGGKWRIVLTDVEIRPRINFDPTRKKSHGQSLWDRSISANPEVATIKVNGSMQLLAFDDLV